MPYLRENIRTHFPVHASRESLTACQTGSAYVARPLYNLLPVILLELGTCPTPQPADAPPRGQDGAGVQQEERELLMGEVNGTRGLFSQGRWAWSTEPALCALPLCFSLWSHLFSYLYESAFPFSSLRLPFPVICSRQNYYSIVPVGGYGGKKGVFSLPLISCHGPCLVCSRATGKGAPQTFWPKGRVLKHSEDRHF